MVRLFVAVYPPPDLVAALAAALAGEDLPDGRLTPAEQVHLTLHFIGNVLPRDVEATAESVRRAAAGLPAATLVPQRLITLPERGPQRLVAVETDAPPTLLELQHRLVVRLAHHPRPASQQRFLPHMTLCRFRKPTTMAPLDRPLALPPFPLREVKLMRSHLEPAGARHVEIAAVTLGGRVAGEGDGDSSCEEPAAPYTPE